METSQAAEEALRAVLASGYIGQGPKVAEFERQLSNEFLSSRLITTNSATSALDLALHIVGATPLESVISTPLTCTATNGVIHNRRSHLIWADVDPITGLITPETVRAAVEYSLKNYPSRMPKAVMGVNWSGASPDYTEIKALGIPVIEDAAHCYGASYEPGMLSESRGTYTVWSFQAIKFLTTGDGGALTLPTEEQYQRAKLLRWYGLNRESKANFRCDQDILEVGYKYHMNDISATIGLNNLRQAKINWTRQMGNAAQLCSELESFAGPRDDRPIVVPPYDRNSSYWIFFILLPPEKRADFMAFMDENGVETSLVHKRNDQHTAFNGASRRHELKGLDWYSKRYVAVPCGWWMDEQQISHVADLITGFAEDLRGHGYVVGTPPSMERP